MKVYFTLVELGISHEKEVDPQDIVDAINTIVPASKIEIINPHPGEGPNHFLAWSKEEIEEINSSTNGEVIKRKAYNSSVYSKCAVECLIDWYLSKYLLNLTLKPYSGIAQKLEALDSENLLGISFSLFNDVVFEPRNRGIHKYESVDKKEAIHSYELANLTIRNCRHSVSPDFAPIFYGSFEYLKDNEALAKLDKEFNFRDKATAFYFGGIGDKGNCSVFIDREIEDGKISVLTSLGDGKIDCIYSSVRNKFSSEQIRHVFQILESNKPVRLDLKKDEIKTIIESLSQKKKPNKT